MARRGSDGERPDAYERAAQRIDADRRSRNLGDPIPVPPPGLGARMPDRRKMRRTLYLIGGLLVLLVVGQITARSRDPELPASCTTLRLAVDPTEVRQGRAVSWSATGPSGRSISVTVGGKQVSPPGTTLANCTATGKFVLPALPPGRHDVTVRTSSGGAIGARPTVTS